jgi:hypothetical protein
MNIVLTRDTGQRDVIACTLPTLPERFTLHRAQRAASGFTEGDEAALAAAPEGTTVTASGKADGESLVMVGVAAIGLCVVSGLDLRSAGKLRDVGRDVVRYGELVITALWEAGYRDIGEISTAGGELLKACAESLAARSAAVASEVRGFPKAPAAPIASGAP